MCICITTESVKNQSSEKPIHGVVDSITNTMLRVVKIVGYGACLCHGATEKGADVAGWFSAKTPA